MKTTTLGRRARTIGVATTTAAFVAVGAASASASTLRSGSTAGAALAAGSTIGAPLTGSATFMTRQGPVTCTSGGFESSVGTNPALAVALTAPALSLGSTTTPCTGPTAPNAAGRFFSFTLVSAGPMDITSNASGTGGAFRAGSLVLRARIGFPRTVAVPNGTCDFAVNTAAGPVLNTDSTLRLTNVPISSATGLCASLFVDSGSYLSATFGPLTSNGAPVVVTQ